MENKNLFDVREIRVSSPYAIARLHVLLIARLHLEKKVVLNVLIFPHGWLPEMFWMSEFCHLKNLKFSCIFIYLNQKI
jgi:hypothetical protein